MSVSRFLKQGAAGNAGGGSAPPYVEDVFTTSAYRGVQETFNVNGSVPLSTYDGIARYRMWNGSNDYVGGGRKPNTAGESLVTVDYYRIGTGNNHGRHLVKFDADGEIVWYRDYLTNTTTGINIIDNIEGSKGSTSFYARIREKSTGANRYGVSKIDTNGNVEWTRCIDGTSGLTISAVHGDASDNCYVACNYTGVNPYGTLVFKLSSDGTLQWERLLQQSTNRIYQAFGLDTDSDGNLYIASYKYNGTATNGMQLTKLSATDGSLLFSKGMANSSGSCFDCVVDNNDDVYVVGRYYSGAYTKLWYTKFNSSGTQQWSKQVDYGNTCNTRQGIGVADGVVYCVATAAEQVIVFGFDSSGNRVVENGFGIKERQYAGASGAPAFGVNQYGTVFVGAGIDRPNASVYHPFYAVIQKFKDFTGDFGNTTLVPAGGTISNLSTNAANESVTSSSSSIGIVSVSYSFPDVAGVEKVPPSIDITVGPTESDGGMVWHRHRMNDSNLRHVMVDSERKNASGYHKEIYPTTTDLEYDPGSTLSNMVTSSFNPGGYTVETSQYINRDDVPCVGWVFRKHPGFFDVVTYTGDGSSSRAIPHNLGSAPGFIIIKGLDFATHTPTYHRTLGAGYRTYMNSTAAPVSTTAFFGTEPTSTDFYIGNHDNVNTNGSNYVAYLFAHDDQRFGTNEDEPVIKCGNFTTNSSGIAEVDLGFEPQWLLAKKTSGTGAWGILDLQRNFGFDGTNRAIYLNTSGEGNNTVWYRRTKGFYFTSGSHTNGTFMYVAIRGPHKPASLQDASSFYKHATSANELGDDPGFRAPFSPDVVMYRDPAIVQNMRVCSKVIGEKRLETGTTAAEVADTNVDWGHNNGAMHNISSTTYRAWMFRRAPGFLDTVTYAGTGTAGLSIDHHLGVVPEMMWVKRRNSTQGWACYHYLADATPENGALQIESDISFVTSNVYWNNTAPTDTHFTLGSSQITNNSTSTYIAFLWASVEGQCKIGSYVGDGTTDGSKVIDCGFQPRLVMIKKATSTGHWFWYDSERGIETNAVDHQLKLNDSSSETTSQDKIDYDASGFKIKNNAGSAEGQANRSNETYIFMAMR